ncbi:MAG: capsule assembly Wzi family protein [Candidatus Edwardsbacteria bacterium]|nr:capsule assembly Wzi family protein [Candidatus Edwardsbacteria bacterium]
MRKIIILASLLAIPFLAPANEDSRDIPLDHWSYPVLQRFQAKGYVSLPVSKPYQRWQVIEQLQDLLRRQMDGAAGLSTTDRYYFDQLSQELNIGTTDRRLSDEEIFSYDDGRAALSADISLGLEAAISHNEPPQSRGTGMLDVFGGMPDIFIFDQRITLTLEKETEKVERLSGSLKSWRGGEYSTGWAYFRTSHPYLALTLGRQQRWWGPGTFGTLLLSDNSEGFDAVDLELNYKRVELQSFFGILSTDQKRYISGHRLGIKLPWNIGWGFSEAVVYQANQIDPAYMNPLLPYYANQWNQRDDDNVLWSADIRWTPGRGFSTYGELLMDDVQYEQDPPAPQKLGFLLGGHWADPAGLTDSDLRVEWAGNQKWVYTHRRYANRYVGADTVHILGHWVGTDADALDMVLEHRFHPRLNAGVGYQMERHGEGRIDRGYLEADDPGTSFLSGAFSRMDKGEIIFQWEPFYWVDLTADIWLAYVKNPNNRPGTGCNDRGLDLLIEIYF